MDDKHAPALTDQRRAVRQLAMQVLYQIDMTGDADAGAVLETLDDAFGDLAMRQAAVQLAIAVWSDHVAADEQISQLTPDWPTHRQPPVDRAILRLAFYEMQYLGLPVRIAINEAIELAKVFSGENSPAFINGVLDKLAHNLRHRPATPATDDAAVATAPDADQWLDQAIKEAPDSGNDVAGNSADSV